MLCHGCRRVQVSISSFLCVLISVQCSTQSFANRALTRAFSHPAFVPPVGPNNQPSQFAMLDSEDAESCPFRSVVLECRFEVVSN
jgi:hypothetical protein